MIEGLKVTVFGSEVAELAIGHAAYHRERAEAYSAQAVKMEGIEIEPSKFTSGGGDPREQLKSKKKEHEGAAQELDFIAAHLKPAEEYLLDLHDLVKLGIVKSRY